MDDNGGRYEELLKVLLEAKNQKWKPSKVTKRAAILEAIPSPFVIGHP